MAPQTYSPNRNWGGRRPGAGAPKGNLNALKRGTYSKQIQTLSILLASVPELQDAFLAVQRARQRRLKKARSIAFLFFQKLAAYLPKDALEKINRVGQPLTHLYPERHPDSSCREKISKSVKKIKLDKGEIQSNGPNPYQSLQAGDT